MSTRNSAKPRASAPRQWKITGADLDAMPSGLRRALLRYLGERTSPLKVLTKDAPLDRKKTTALLREVSFDRSGRSLRRLLDCFARPEPPTRRELAQALSAKEREKLGRHLARINRLSAKTTGDSDARLWHYRRAEGRYTIHPSTRKWLRQLLPGLEHAGEHEEPLWD